jgi:phosphomannomutase
MPAGVISFTCIDQKAKGAINISASHNPRQYSGMKPYNHKGGHMEIEETNRIEEIMNTLDYFDIDISGEYKYLQEKDVDRYIDTLLEKIPLIENDFSNAKITYTPLHGTSYEFFTRLAKKLNIDLDVVESQKDPLPGFDNIISPNPQD